MIGLFQSSSSATLTIYNRRLFFTDTKYYTQVKKNDRKYTELTV